MRNTHIKKLHFILLLLLVITQTVQAKSSTVKKQEAQQNTQQEQNNSPRNTSVSNDGGYTYIQNLEWKQVKGATKYVIVILRKYTNEKDSQKVGKAVEKFSVELEEEEKKNGTPHIDVNWDQEEDIEDGYEKVFIYGTKENSITVMLPYGIYQYKIITYIRNRAFKAPWHELDIRPALQPRITSTEPKRFYVDIENPDKLIVHGINFEDDSDFYLNGEQINNIVHEKDSEENLDEAEKKKREYIDVDTNKITSITVTNINGDAFKKGSHELTVVNKGGNSDSIKIEKGFWYTQELMLGAGYTPAFLLQSTEFEKYFGTGPQWKCVTADMTWIPFKLSELLYLGLDLQPSVTFTDAALGKCEINSTFVELKTDLSAQFNINRHWFCQTNAGLNWFFLNSMYITYSDSSKSTSLFSWYIGFNAMARLGFIFDNGVYVMASVDGTFNEIKDINEVYIRPGILAGYRFKFGRGGRK